MHSIIAQARAEATRLFSNTSAGGPSAARALLGFAAKLRRTMSQIVHDQFTGASLPPHQAREAAEAVVILSDLRQEARKRAKRALRSQKRLGFRKDPAPPPGPNWKTYEPTPWRPGEGS